MPIGTRRIVLVAGLLLVVVPVVVTVVTEDAEILLPVALLLGVLALDLLWAQRRLLEPRSLAGALLAVLVLLVGVVADVASRSHDDPVPHWLELLPRAGYVAAGLALLVAGVRGGSSAGRRAPPRGVAH